MDQDYLVYALTALEHPENWVILPDDEQPGYHALCASLRPLYEEAMGDQQGVVVIASHGDVEALMAIRAAFCAAYVGLSETAWEFTGETTNLPEEIA